LAEFTTLFPRETSVGAGTLARTAESTAARIPMRPIKIVIGASLLMAGIYGIVSDRQFLSTDSAVVTAYQTEVRTPIDGILSGLPASAGGRLAEGEVLGSVDNQRLDPQHLESLGLLAQQTSSSADAMRIEQAALLIQEKELRDRAAIDLRAVAIRLRAQQAEAERLLAARIADQLETRRQMDRGRQLHTAGILADAEFERLQSANAVSIAEEAAQRAAVATLQTEAMNADEGILTEPGNNSDVPYSRQRADEVRMRLAELERNRASLQSQASQVLLGAEAEQARISLMRHSELIAPVAGMLWKLDAVNGERIGTGDAVARIVDCDHSFVLAEIPQDGVPEVMIRAPARFRLTGESLEHYGKVVAISGDPQRDEDTKLAAFPAQNPREHLATVRISLDETPGEGCEVGRSARVLISLRDSSLFVRLARRYL
jgi:multidrug resistance efflux pump